ncbi:MAG: sugar ABC transporter permease [Streptosporangiales bacterium]|nr:sugar ABC transporter permease [Streptosporangiales bacterium]
MTVTPATAEGSRPSGSRNLFPFVLLLPGLAMFLAVVVYPLASALVSGFFAQSLVEPGRRFVGLQNYADVLSDQFLPVFEHTVVFAGATTLASFVIGLGLALALNGGIRGQGFLRGLFLFPWVVPSVVVSFLWLWIFNGDYGVLDALLLKLHLVHDRITWLGEPGTAMAAVVVAKTWASFPWMMVMLLAGLQTTPAELHEAAQVDGAGSIRRFFTVSWPHIRGIAGIVLLLELIWNLQHFDMIYVLTGGGPAGATTTFAVAVYQAAFQGFDLGHAGALGGLWMVILMALVVVYVRRSERSA